MPDPLWNAPVSEQKMAEILETLDLRSCQSVLDVGCGSGEVLIRLHERFPVQGVGYDLSEGLIAKARHRAAGRVDAAAIRFLQADVRTLEIAPESVDLAMCLGSTHAFELGQGAYGAALKHLRNWVVPGGLLLLGEGYLKRPASPEYRAILGDFLPDDRTHAANVRFGTDLGLIPLGAWTSSLDEWDQFEWSLQRIVERLSAEGEKSPENNAKLDRRREWMNGYLQWGRETLGYGTYLFRRPA